MAFVLRLGRIQTAIILFIIYFLVIGPVSVLMRVVGRRDLLELHAPKRSSFGQAKTQVPTDPERCERQF
jgi:hypothetical protein